MSRSFPLPLLAIFAAGAAMAGPQPVMDPISQAAGIRAGLEERGISAGLTVTTEIFSLLHGGTGAGRGSECLGSLAPSLRLDLTRLGFGRGEFYLSAQSLHGRGINDSRVGAVQVLSNLEERKFRKFLEAWYADSYRNGLLRIKAGRQYADAEFGVVENGAEFLNSSYGLNPTTPMPSYPTPELGASLRLAPVSWLSSGFGVYRSGGGLSRSSFMIVETRVEPYRQSAASHGSYGVGVWRQSRRGTAEKRIEPERGYGVYVIADHWFMRSASDDHAGPGLFFQWGWTPSNRIEIAGYTGAGVAWAGVIPSRQRDSAGMGVTRARLSGGKNETIIEWFYKCQLTARLTLKPDLQWVIKPSGHGRNALVAGLRMGLEF